jgi:hypothetical protein
VSERNYGTGKIRKRCRVYFSSAREGESG